MCPLIPRVFCVYVMSSLKKASKIKTQKQEQTQGELESLNIIRLRQFSCTIQSISILDPIMESRSPRSRTGPVLVRDHSGESIVVKCRSDSRPLLLKLYLTTLRCHYLPSCLALDFRKKIGSYLIG